MDSSAEILIVEDENSVARFLYQAVAEAGYSPTACGNGAVALEIALGQRFDLILLDWMLPGLSGLEVCQRLRERGVSTPVLIITARDSVEDKIAGLDAGADDYIAKPFELGELLARMRALLRRFQSAPKTERSEVLSIGDLSLDLQNRKVTRAGSPIALSSTEFALLQALASKVGRVVSREELFKDVWDFDFGGDPNVLHVYISYLRTKLEKNGQSKLIHTVRGIGYRLEALS